MTVAAVSAEWICTRCGATNRKLVPAEMTRVADRCVTCGAKHTVTPEARPVRWDAVLAS
jgi:DNA-directed RNA polymerase subunit RPC12/RpoP